MKLISTCKTVGIILSAIIFFFLMGVVGYLFINNNRNLETQYVSLGTKFVLHENQSAIIKNEGLEIKVLKFYNSPCPSGVLCGWSGIGIGLEYKYKNEVKKGINLVKAFGYKTDIIDTDHETYIKLRVNKIEEVLQ